uniref:Uncharacterized protein n=1 Tax=Mycena chlorophos TaxID=658473 RepID=A0ABQ0LAU5_MYCCL|nr:predicted protein [Mycena chlorophos]
MYAMYPVPDILSDRVGLVWVSGDPDKQRLRRDTGFWYLGIGNETQRRCSLNLWLGLKDICALGRTGRAWYGYRQPSRVDAGGHRPDPLSADE